MPFTLPVSNIVDVDVILSPAAATAPAINTAMIIGTSAVIDTSHRVRLYTSLTEVALDFGTTTPEYLAASLWFGQNPSPDTLYIGRWFKTAAPGQLIGGPLTPPNLLMATWQAVTNGAFNIFIDGVPYVIGGMNFSGTVNLNDVAALIQTTIRTATGALQTVVFDGVYTRFVLTDSATGSTSIVGFALDPAAVGHAAFSGQPTATTDTITVNGHLITFVSGTPGTDEVQIGGTLAITLQNLLTFLTTSTSSNLTVMNYYVSGSTIYFYSKATGTTGQAYTLAKSSTAITLSGANLTGGGGTFIGPAMSWQNVFGNGAYVAPGVDAESALTGVTIIDERYANQAYGLIVLDADDTDHEQIAGYVEGVAPKHYYGITTQEAGVLVPGDTANLAYILKSLQYHHTAIQYSAAWLVTNAYAIASYLARILTTNWLGSNTTITLMFKSEPGVQPENLVSSEAAAADAVNCNVYVTYENGTQFIQYGKSCSGQFTDTVIGADWLAGQVQANVFNTLYTAPTKIPQTDAGMGQLAASAQAACELAVNNGYCGPGQWNAPGFGELTTGKQLNKGYYIYAPPMATQPQANRAAREGTVMQIAIKTAGAIHTDDIIMTIQP